MMSLFAERKEAHLLRESAPVARARAHAHAHAPFTLIDDNIKMEIKSNDMKLEHQLSVLWRQQ